MASISSPGIASGLDIQSIVSQLVALEKAPLTQLKSKATSFQTKLSTMGTIKSQVAALGDAAAKLSKNTGWNGVKATSSNPSAIGVTVKAGAPATSITMEVQNLAKAQSHRLHRRARRHRHGHGQHDHRTRPMERQQLCGRQRHAGHDRHRRGR
jgi:flagellar hook-associated protein 2